MQLRQSTRLLAAAGALLLAAPVLTSCGFDYATDRVYTPGAGTNARDASVDVLNAVIVSAQEGSGTLVASFSNNDQGRAIAVQSVEGTGKSSDVSAKSFSPIEVDPGQLVSPVGETGESSSIVLTGDFKAGDVVSLKFGFDNGQSAELDVPVVPPCHEYRGLDKSGSGSGSSSSSSSSEDLCSVETASGEPSVGVS